MKVKELRKYLEKVEDEFPVILELFSTRVELEMEDIAVVNDKELVISPDEGAFLSSPFTSDNE